MVSDPACQGQLRLRRMQHPSRKTKILNTNVFPHSGIQLRSPACDRKRKSPNSDTTDAGISALTITIRDESDNDESDGKWSLTNTIFAIILEKTQIGSL